MNYIPQRVIVLFRQLFNQISQSSTDNEDYKEKILQMAEDEEERKDLEELFKSTTAYYNEREKISNSSKGASEYLQDFYLEEWDKQHPNATEEEKGNAIKEYEDVLSDSIENIIESFANDGRVNHAVNRIENQNKDSKCQEDVIQQYLEENNVFGLEEKEDVPNQEI